MQCLITMQAQSAKELELREGDVVTVLGKGDGGIWTGQCRGKTGKFPSSCVEEMPADKLSFFDF